MDKEILVVVLVVTLIYLHVKQGHLIFQHDIKVAKKLTIILLCILALGGIVVSLPFDCFSMKSARYGIFLHSILFWTLSIIAFWKLLSGCYKDAFFQKTGRSGQSLREKVKDIILEAVQKNEQSEAFSLFLETRFADFDIESVRLTCKSICSWPEEPLGRLSSDQIEKLKTVAGQLG